MPFNKLEGIRNLPSNFPLALAESALNSLLRRLQRKASGLW